MPRSQYICKVRNSLLWILWMLMFLNVKIGELYLGYNYEEGGAAAELPSCPQSWEPLLPPSQLPHVQKIRHTTSQCSLDNSAVHFCKNDFNHRLMCDGCADSSWIWRLGSWRNRAFHDKILALAERILEILRNGEKIRGFERWERERERESGLGGVRWSRAVKLWSDLWRLVWEIFLLFWQIWDLQDTKTMFGEPQWV